MCFEVIPFKYSYWSYKKTIVLQKYFDQFLGGGNRNIDILRKNKGIITELKDTLEFTDGFLQYKPVTSLDKDISYSELGPLKVKNFYVHCVLSFRNSDYQNH